MKRIWDWAVAWLARVAWERRDERVVHDARRLNAQWLADRDERSGGAL